MADEPVQQQGGGQPPIEQVSSLDAAVQAELDSMGVDGEGNPVEAEGGEGEGGEGAEGDGAEGEGEDQADDGADDAADEGDGADDSGDEGDEGDGDAIEWRGDDGKAYKVPKALEGHLMNAKQFNEANAQARAYYEQVQAREAALPTLFDAGQAFQTEALQLAYVRAQRQQIEATDWATLRVQDPQEFSARSAELMLLDKQEGQLLGSLTDKKQKLEAHQEKARLDQANALAATLAREHKVTPERFKKIQTEAHARFGKSSVVMKALHDGAVGPEVYLALEELAEFRALKASKGPALQKARQAASTAQRVVMKPGPATQSVQRPGNVVNKAHGRLRASGSVQDAVAMELALMDRGSRKGRR